MPVSYRVEIDPEADGRFRAEVREPPGVLAHGETAEDALAHAQALALRVPAVRLERGEGPRGSVRVSFETFASP
jgi:predicted RNase H-like HicB family nuclease